MLHQPAYAGRSPLKFAAPMDRLPHIHHCTSEPYRFFGRAAELALLDAALTGAEPSVAALAGPGGQGKTAIVQHWLERILSREPRPDGLFLWSFYRGKDADLCLRELYAYAARLGRTADVSASYCVDHLLPILRRERWALVFDGTEVAQYDNGPWRGRFLHPEFGRLLEELASEPLPGVVVLTTRFDLPTLAHRRCARLISLAALDADSARALLTSLGVRGDDAALDAVAAAGGNHAKAVELLGAYLARYHDGDAGALAELPEPPAAEGASPEEVRVARVLAAWQRTLPAEAKDVIGLATAFRDPPAESRLLEYLVSSPVQILLHETWRRPYEPFGRRPAGWLQAQLDDLIHLRLLERVGRHGPASAGEPAVIDAHPLVRRSFEHVLGAAGRREGRACGRGSCAAGPTANGPRRWYKPARTWRCFTPIATPDCGRKPTPLTLPWTTLNTACSPPPWNATCCCASSPAATGGGRRRGRASVDIGVWRSVWRCSANTTTPWPPTASRTPPCAATP